VWIYLFLSRANNVSLILLVILPKMAAPPENYIMVLFLHRTSPSHDRIDRTIPVVRERNQVRLSPNATKQLDYGSWQSCEDSSGAEGRNNIF